MQMVAQTGYRRRLVMEGWQLHAQHPKLGHGAGILRMRRLAPRPIARDARGHHGEKQSGGKSRGNRGSVHSVLLIEPTPGHRS